MLEMMRKHAGSWMIKVLLGLIAAAFALSWGAYQYGSPRQEVALKINGEPITLTQLREEEARLNELYSRQFGAQFARVAPMLAIKKQASNNLVERVLLMQAAQQMGIQVANAEIQANLANIKAFQRNGRFDKDIYQRYLSMSRLTHDKFSSILRADLMLEKLSTLVAGSGQVTPLEVDQALERDLTQIKAVYKIFSNTAYFDKVKVSDTDIKSYYDNNRQKFVVPAQVELSYLAFNKNDYTDEADVTDKDIELAYEMERDRYSKPEQVHARHILIKLPENPAEAEVSAARKKAEDVLALVQKPGADFAALAKIHSQGPTASRGGDLGFFRRGQMVPEFEKTAFSLKKGAMGLARSKFGFHVIKAEDHQQAQVTPLKEVHQEIKGRLVERQARELAKAAAERALDLAAQKNDPKVLAAKLKKSLMDTAAVPLTGPVPGLPGLKNLPEALEGTEEGQVLPALNYDDGSILAFIKKRIPQTFRPLKEVEEEVRLAVRQEKAAQAAREAAAKLLKELAAKPSEAAQTLLGQKGTLETNWLKIDGSVEGLSSSELLVQALFLRPAAAPVITQPIDAGDGFAVAVLKERKPPTTEEMKAQRTEFKERLIAGKKRLLLDQFRQDLRASAKIQMLAAGL